MRCPHLGQWLLWGLKSAETVKGLAQFGQVTTAIGETFGVRVIEAPLQLDHTGRRSNLRFWPATGGVPREAGGESRRLAPHSLPRRQPPRGIAPARFFCPGRAVRGMGPTVAVD